MNIPTGKLIGKPSSSKLPDDQYSDSEIAKLLVLESQTYQSNYDPINGSVLAGKALRTNKRFLKSVIRNANDHNRQLERKPEASSALQLRIPGDDAEERYTHTLRTIHRTCNRRSQLISGEDHKGSEERYRCSSKSTSRNYDYNDHYNHDSNCPRSKGKRPKERSRLSEVEFSPEAYNRLKARKSKNDRQKINQDYPDSHQPLQRKISHDRKDSKIDFSTTSSSVSLPIPSKMDKYFASSYDPRLDVNLDDITDPTTGLIQGGNYDDWGAILAQMKAKREEKERQKERKLEEKLAAAQRKLKKREKKERKREKSKKRRRNSDKSDDGEKEIDTERHRQERSETKKRRRELELSDRSKLNYTDGEDQRKSKNKHSRKKSYSSSESSYSSSEVSSSSDHSSVDPQRDNPDYSRRKTGLMDIKGYAKPGKIREWDLGKASPT